MVAKPTCLIGVDIGTTGTKAAVFDDAGRLLGQAFEESRLVYPRSGWVEQDLEEMYASCLNTIRASVGRSRIDPRDVAGIAVDGQMAGIGGVRADGTASTRYDSWLDTRCEPYIELMRKEAGDLVLEVSGSPPTYDHGPKILWWMHEEPEAFKTTARFVVPSAYAAMRMAGLGGEDAFIDYTQLHFSGFGDIERLAWSEDLCGIFGVPREKLPRILAPWEIVGRLTSEAADLTGLVPGTPIAAGAGDQAATSLGAGIVRPGQVFDVAGTASVFSVCTGERVVDLEHRTFLSARSVIRGLWVPIAYINGGGLCLKWFRDQVAAGWRAAWAGSSDLDYAALDRMAEGVSPGSDGLLFVPHFGGRATPNDPNIRGAWLGLSWGHGLAHLYRAILEGIAYEYRCYADALRDLLPAVRLTGARVIGGGAKSALWNRIKADVLGFPYTGLDRQEVAVWGSALIAGFAVGVYPDLAQAAIGLTQAAWTFAPDEGAHRAYEPYARAYAHLVGMLGASLRILREPERTQDTTQDGGQGPTSR